MRVRGIQNGTNVFVSSRRIDWHATWPIRVITWPWPEVKFWNWPFKVPKYTFRFVLKRKTRQCQNHSPIFQTKKVICKKSDLRQKRLFSLCMTSGAEAVDLSWNLTPHLRKSFTRAIERFFFLFLSSYYSFWDNGGCPGKCPYMVKFGLWWSLVISILTWLKKDRCNFRSLCHGLSNVFYRFSLHCLIFENSGGGGYPPPPHPSALSSPRPPSVRGLISWIIERRLSADRMVKWIAAFTSLYASRWVDPVSGRIPHALRFCNEGYCGRLMLQLF